MQSWEWEALPPALQPPYHPAHACHVDREALWSQLAAKLRARYGFMEEAGDGQC